MQKSQTDSESASTLSHGSSEKKETKTIKWNEWNPFQRATGEALRQLNKRQRRQPKYQPDAQEALL